MALRKPHSMTHVKHTGVGGCTPIVSGQWVCSTLDHCQNSDFWAMDDVVRPRAPAEACVVAALGMMPAASRLTCASSEAFFHMLVPQSWRQVSSSVFRACWEGAVSARHPRFYCSWERRG